MAVLPDINTLIGPAVTQGGFKTGLAQLWAYLLNPSLNVVYTTSETPQDAFLRVDCSISGSTNTTLLAANDTNARPTVCYKVDNTAGVATFTDPTTGFAFVVDVQWEAIRLIPDATANVWMKQV